MPDEKSPDAALPDAVAPAPQRQRVVRVPGSRRAQLTPVAGSDPSPDVATNAAREKKSTSDGGPNDARMRDDVPPHY